MLEYAKFEFELSKAGKDGKSQRWHLEVVESKIGRKPKELIPPCEIPIQLIHIWRHFISLDNARSVGFSANPITYVDIDAYTRLMNVKMSALEVNAITQMDRLKREILA